MQDGDDAVMSAAIGFLSCSRLATGIASACWCAAILTAPPAPIRRRGQWAVVGNPADH